MNRTMKVTYRGGYSKPWDSPANSPGLYRTNPVTGEMTFHSQSVSYTHLTLPTNREV